MKLDKITPLAALTIAFMSSNALAFAPAQTEISDSEEKPVEQAQFEITLTNGGAMPASRPIVWIARDRAGVPETGSDSTLGHRNVCESGNSDVLAEELRSNRRVRWVHQEPEPILPGQSITIRIPRVRMDVESVYIDFMYGRSRNVCGGIFDLNLKQANFFGNPILGRDTVFQSGGYELANSSLNPKCAGAENAVSCLRSMSAVAEGDNANQISLFTGYLPSVLNSIENVFGASATQGLQIPTSGAIQYKVKKLTIF